jgi:Ca2+-binding EF-hand superfamily protein
VFSTEIVWIEKFSMSEIRRCFDSIDVSRRGYLSKDRLRRVLERENFECEISDELIDRMFSMADVDGAGLVL